MYFEWQMPGIDFFPTFEPGQVRGNFVVCPHCKAKSKVTMLTGFMGRPTRIVRSDGVQFHLCMVSEPIVYPPNNEFSRTPVASIGFWYEHDKVENPGRMVAVLITKVPEEKIDLRTLIEEIATALANFLVDHAELHAHYECDGETFRAYDT